MTEEHWAYMDRFELVARGPTFRDDDTLTGSLHVVDVPDAAAARAFAFDEPCYQAGAYRDVLIRRTRWHRVHDHTEGYLVLGFLPEPRTATEVAPPPGDLAGFGPLLSDDGTMLLGIAVLTREPDVLPLEEYAAVEVHRWERGGRR
jgi:uncharacterized protein YciI